MDPITREYAYLTPYQFASNTPIQAIDLDGLEGVGVQLGGRVTLLLFSGSPSFSMVGAKDGISLYFTLDAGLGAGVSVGAGLEGIIYPTLENSTDLSGWGASVGGSFMGNGADINFALQKDENDRISDYKGGVSFSIPGAGAGAGAEGHLTGSYSWLLVTYTWEEIMSKVGVIANQTGQDKETIEKGILAIQEQYGSLTKKTQESVQQKQTEASSQQKYTVQMGAFGSEKNAKRRADNVSPP